MKAEVCIEIVVSIRQITTLFKPSPLPLIHCTPPHSITQRHIHFLLVCVARHRGKATFEHAHSVAAFLNSSMSKCTDSYLVYIPLGAGIPLQYDE